MLHIIANVSSGTGRARRDWKCVVETLDEQKAEYKVYKTEGPGHATRLAQEISSLPGDVIDLVIMGGDGTVNEVINGITDFSRVRIGLIPTGSGNDFARGLGLTGTTKENTMRIIKAQSERTIDLGRVKFFNGDNSRLFAISSGVGMDAIVCKKALDSRLKRILNRVGLGKLTYLLLTLETILDMINTTAIITYDGKKTVKYRRMIFIAAMNAFAEGGGVPMAPRAKVDSQNLTMCTAFAISKYVTFFVLPVLVMAKHEKFRCFNIQTFMNGRIKLAQAMTVHADGEYCGEHDELEFECVPGIMRMIW